MTDTNEDANMQHNYIIRIRDSGYSIVGPFDSREALRAWGEADQAASGDDPRWQSVYLADPGAAPGVVAPGPPPPCRRSFLSDRSRSS